MNNKHSLSIDDEVGVGGAGWTEMCDHGEMYEVIGRESSEEGKKKNLNLLSRDEKDEEEKLRSKEKERILMKNLSLLWRRI